MAFALSPEAAAAGHRVQSFDTIGSTNTEALARARDGEPGPLWFASRHQSAGRGRRGNTWSTARGNLAASLLMTTGAHPSTIANLGFVAGVALVRALESCVSLGPALPPAHVENLSSACHSGFSPQASPGTTTVATADRGGRPARFALKWPNDVLVGGAKLAGILLETERLPGGGSAVVVGIGVNIASAPEGVPYAVTSLAALRSDVAPETLFEALSAAWVEAEAVWNGGDGFATIRRFWLDRASGLGGAIRVRVPGRDLAGTFETIDEHGRLLLRMPEGTLTPIAAGEVHFSNAAAA